MVVLFTLDANSRIPNYKLSVDLEWFSNISSQCSRLENEMKYFADENAINNKSTINIKQFYEYSYRAAMLSFVLMLGFILYLYLLQKCFLKNIALSTKQAIF